MLTNSSEAADSSTEEERRKASQSYVLMVQHLIERCIVLQLDRDQCVRALAKHARVLPAVTTVVWHELEKENKEFFCKYAEKRQEKRRRLQQQQQVSSSPSDVTSATVPASVWSCPQAVSMLRKSTSQQQQSPSTAESKQVEGQASLRRSDTGSDSTPVVGYPEVQVGYPVSYWGANPYQAVEYPQAGMLAFDWRFCSNSHARQARKQDMEVEVSSEGLGIDKETSEASSASSIPT